MISLHIWAGVLLSLVIATCATCVPAGEREKREVGNYDAYSVVVEHTCGGAYLQIMHLDWESIESPTQAPASTVVYSEFVSAADTIFTDKDAFYAFLAQLVERIQGAIQDNDADFSDWGYVYFQYLLSSDLFALNDSYMTTWYQWLMEWYNNKDLNPFYSQGEWVRVVSGEEAASNWWLGLNSLRSDGYFNSNGAITDSYGVLGQSRGSTQISFVPSSGAYDGHYPVYAGGRRYPLYSANNDGYGWDFLHFLLLSSLAEENPDAKVITSPCVMKGDEYMIELSGRHYRVTGSGDYAACAAKVEFYWGELQKVYGSGDGAGAGGLGGYVGLGGFAGGSGGSSGYIGGKVVPSVADTTFFVMGEYDAAFRALGVIDAQGKVDLSLFKQKTQEFSSKTVNEIVKQYPDLNANLISKIYQLGIYSPKVFESYGFEAGSAKIYTPRKADGSVSVKLSQQAYENASRGGAVSGAAASGGGGDGSLGWTYGATLDNLPPREDCFCARQ
ncbi:uncharacterized protein LOC135473726 [Liolophura sinensis]|uniref:uncharacterized protein LOC135473726 n=1 Tax=Liolophura sinensis TaxID=3198878 RepID=UPI00315933D6